MPVHNTLLVYPSFGFIRISDFFPGPVSTLIFAPACPAINAAGAIQASSQFYMLISSGSPHTTDPMIPIHLPSLGFIPMLDLTYPLDPSASLINAPA
ncbi:hypothetical protein R3P38DRAFT_3209230 [Favolaschia claudopus]|uniref:Uncharacterized protein n=1 Tax=Favolaschia claudopus TaxID=2862362 RepID=A0AAW0AHZ5_9AGAR